MRSEDELGLSDDEPGLSDDELGLSDDELDSDDNEPNWDDDELGWDGKLNRDGKLVCGGLDDTVVLLLLICCIVLQKSGLHLSWHPKQCKGLFIKSFCSFEIAVGLSCS